jgi:hypothetical protein
MTTTTRFAITRTAIGSLFGQARSQRVIYLGTFSKTMFPGLRLAYLVVPEDLAEAFAIGNAELYREGRLIEQAALAEFIEEGHLSTHLRRVRTSIRNAVTCCAKPSNPGSANLVSTSGGLAGLHLPYFFNHALDDVALSREMLEAGIVLRPLSMYYADSRQRRSGMILGFAAVDAKTIETAADNCAPRSSDAVNAGKPWFTGGGGGRIPCSTETAAAHATRPAQPEPVELGCGGDLRGLASECLRGWRVMPRVWRFFHHCQPVRPGRTSCSRLAASRIIFSVVGQSTQASVTEQP